MAVSIALKISGAVVGTPNSSSLANPKFSRLVSLQIPSELCFFRCRKLSPISNSRPRSLTLVASKKQFSSFDELLERSDKPVFVDFYATWCGPCQFMVPVLEQLSSLMKDMIQVVKIDTEKYPSIADKFKIAALPTFILFVDGKPCDRFEGALSAEKLIERIKTSLQVKQ